MTTDDICAKDVYIEIEQLGEKVKYEDVIARKYSKQFTGGLAILE